MILKLLFLSASFDLWQIMINRVYIIMKIRFQNYTLIIFMNISSLSMLKSGQLVLVATLSYWLLGWNSCAFEVCVASVQKTLFRGQVVGALIDVVVQVIPMKDCRWLFHHAYFLVWYLIRSYERHSSVVLYQEVLLSSGRYFHEVYVRFVCIYAIF